MPAFIHKVITSKHWLMVLILIGLLVAPILLSDFRLNLLGRFTAFAILAVGLGLLWGYAGVLSLGHGIFFGIGAYATAMFLTLQSTDGLPDFMVWNGVQQLPILWSVVGHPVAALFAAIGLPMLLAAVLGFFTFRNRIKGVYFTILTQALVIVTTTLIVSQQHVTGGTNGITGFHSLFGISLAAPSTQKIIYFTTVVCLFMTYIICAVLINSRFGKVLVAIRDGENRSRFLGYDTSLFKVFVFSISAGMAGLAGMLYVMQVGIISPTMIGIVPSIEMILWVAIGGRGTLIGPVLGALLTNSAKTFFGELYPDAWQFFLGAVFVAIIVFFPGGLMSLLQKLKGWWTKLYAPNRKQEKDSRHDTQANTSAMS